LAACVFVPAIGYGYMYVVKSIAKIELGYICTWTPFTALNGVTEQRYGNCVMSSFT